MGHEQAIAALHGRIRMMVSRAVIAGVNADPQMQELQVELLADEAQDGVEHFEPYGFTSRPSQGAEALMVCPGGLRSHGIVLAVADRRYRIKGLAEGEVAVFDDQGQKLVLGRDGIVIHGKKVTIESEGDLVLDATGNIVADCVDFTVNASGDAVITADGHAELEGNTIDIGHGATKGAARQDDAVDDTADKISGHSGRVKIA